MDRQLTEQEMRTMFDHMDKNHNGYVTPKELKCYLRANNIKVTNKEVKEFFNRITEIGEIFGKLDKNHNGLVSQKELKAFLKHNSVKYENKEIREFVAKIDDNNDGQISMDEMIKALSGNLDVSKASQLMPR